MLNKFSNKEAIERCIALRDRLPMDEALGLAERWADKDALAQLINIASGVLERNRSNQAQSER